MGSRSRWEINFARLLHRCEQMAEENKENSWRQEKFIEALSDQLSAMKKEVSRPPQEALSEYQKKVDLLKGLTKLGKMPAGTEKVLATERLQVVGSSPGNAPSRQLQVRAKVQSQEDMRQELLGSKNSPDQEIRQRGSKGSKDESDIDSLLQHHHRMQERLAEEMLAHTRALKQNITDAGRVVKDDIKILGETTKLTESNFGKLQSESERLEGFTKSCSWWVWIMLFFVIMTFLAMIVFMKIFPK